MKRCEWGHGHDSMNEYHDKEWGVPVHNDKKLFEMITLEGAQAGLTWITILKRRKGYQKAFDKFDFNKVAKYGKKDFNRLVKDTGIIRNRLKINSTINNAQRFLEIRKEFGTFDKYIWQFTNYKTKKNKFKSMQQLPAFSKESEAMSKDLKKRGFSFVGPTICYAFMQAIGMVNDHQTQCFRYNKLK